MVVHTTLLPKFDCQSTKSQSQMATGNFRDPKLHPGFIWLEIVKNSKDESNSTFLAACVSCGSTEEARDS